MHSTLGITARLPGPADEFVAGGQRVRVLGPQDPSRTGSSAANWSRAPRPRLPPPRSSGPGWTARTGFAGARSQGPAHIRAAAPRIARGPGPRPPFPAHRARLFRRASVRGCSGPRTRSHTGQRYVQLGWQSSRSVNGQANRPWAGLRYRRATDSAYIRQGLLRAMSARIEWRAGR